MTPLRIAVMLGGCWVIPTFISFLPIMQGWNSIGIIDLVSNQGGRPNWCQIHSVLNILLEKAIFREKKAREAEGETSCYRCRGAAEFLEDVSEGFAMTLSWKDCHKGSGGSGRGFFLRLLLLWKHTKPSWLPMGTQGVLGSPWPLQLPGDFWPPKAELGAPSLRPENPDAPEGMALWASPISIPGLV